MNNCIYADNSSTTKLDSRVLSKMMPYLTLNYANASTLYLSGKRAKKAIEDAREKIAKCLNVKCDEIYFTSSGTEADNTILLGYATANLDKGKHIITSKFEHLAVLNTCKHLEELGFDVTYLDVGENGIVDVKDVINNIREDTICISIMYANNEIGTIQDVYEIAKIAREKGIFFHTDAVQAIPHIKIDASKFDSLSMSAHKFNGPKGIGVLYLKSGIKCNNLMYGGHQEKGFRPSTENVAGIVGISEALRITYDEIEESSAKEKNMRDYLMTNLETIPGFHINGDMKHRVNSNLNFYIDGIDSNELRLFLEMNDIYVSGGSACNSSVDSLSHVLKAIGCPKSSIRITLSKDNTINEMKKIVTVIKNGVEIIIKSNINNLKNGYRLYRSI